MRAWPHACLLAVTLALGCKDGGSQAASPCPAPGARRAGRAEAKRTERPLPAFEGTTLGGERIAVSSFLGKRVLLFLFNPEVEDAKTGAKALAALTRIQGSENFAILGIAAGSDRRTLEAFVREQGIDYPVIDDPSATIGRKLGVPVPVALIGADAQGDILFGLGQFPKEGPDPAGAIESYVRSALRLPATAAPVETELGARPMAPAFTAQRLDGGAPFALASLRGKPVILVFFLHTCPHCHHELEFLKKELPKIPESARPALIGVSMLDHVASVQATLQQDGLDFFPVLLDSDYKIRTAYGALAGVPDTFLIDAEGRVVSRTNGWGNPQDEPLMRMRLAKLAGQPVPMLLSATGYSGNEFCAVCHEGPTETWELTAHAGAFATLVRHGADKDTECVGCHVVGWGQPGGYTLTPADPAARERRLRGLPRTRRSPPVAGFREERRLLPGVRDVPQRAALARVLVLRLPPAGRLQVHRPSRRAAAGREAQAAGGQRAAARADPRQRGRTLRGLGGLPGLPRLGVRHLGEESPRAFHPVAREPSRRPARKPVSSVTSRASADPAAFRPAGRWRRIRGSPPSAARIVTGPAAITSRRARRSAARSSDSPTSARPARSSRSAARATTTPMIPGFRFELEAKIEAQKHGTDESRHREGKEQRFRLPMARSAAEDSRTRARTRSPWRRRWSRSSGSLERSKPSWKRR